MPYLDSTQGPSVFGISGYSGAGTKSGQKDSDGRSVTLPKVVCLPPLSNQTIYAYLYRLPKILRVVFDLIV